MNLPKYIELKVTMFGDGAKGMAFQVSRNEEYGVQCDASRKQHGAPWVDTWTSDYLPDREFKTFAELHAAVNAAGDLKKLPAIVERVEPKGRGVARCWLCRGEWTHTVIVKTNWRAMGVERIPTCEADLERVKADPLAAIEARRRYVAARS